MSYRVRIWVEVIPDRSRWGLVGAHVGKTWKRQPKREHIAPGALAVEVVVEVPQSRLENIVRAEVPRAAPVAVAS